MKYPVPSPSNPLPKMAELNKLLQPYQKSSTRRSIWQLVNTLVPYAALWVLMAYSLQVSYWLTLALAVIAAGFLVRIFIFFHDCGHNSFFPSTRANRIVGFWLGALVFTPGEHWWHSHAIHHATSGNLDKRGVGDVTTLTVDEFYHNRWFQKLGYRFFRNPWVMFVLGPVFMFLIMHRLPTPNYGRKETMSVIWTNLVILGMAAAISLAIGWQNYLLIQLPVILIGGAGGIWLFYVQHQFEENYWERTGGWDYVSSALLGASFYKLPRVLDWFSGSIGYHHIHHLSPRIPNYNLRPAHENNPLIQKWTRILTLVDSFRMTKLKLWDEPERKMTGFEAADQSQAVEHRQTAREG